MDTTPITAIDAVLDTPLDTHPLQVYPEVLKQDGSGLHEEIVGTPVKIPDDAKTIDFKITRDVVPDTTDRVFKGRIELSVDGGLTWSGKPNGEKVWPYGMFPVGFSTSGGQYSNPDGSIAAFSGFTNLVLPQGVGRQIRTVLIPLKEVTVSAKVLCKGAIK